jgi:hypothetical protein
MTRTKLLEESDREFSFGSLRQEIEIEEEVRRKLV